jgi:hypothetical protein
MYVALSDHFKDKADLQWHAAIVVCNYVQEEPNNHSTMEHYEKLFEDKKQRTQELNELNAINEYAVLKNIDFTVEEGAALENSIENSINHYGIPKSKDEATQAILVDSEKYQNSHLFIEKCENGFLSGIIVPFDRSEPIRRSIYREGYRVQYSPAQLVGLQDTKVMALSFIRNIESPF